MRVRRVNDDAELDIGFSNGVLDLTSIATHCGANIGRVSIWYDQQEGTFTDLVSDTQGSQPRIWDGAAVAATINGWPAVDFVAAESAGGDAALESLATQTIPANLTWHVIGSWDVMGSGGSMPIMFGQAPNLGTTSSAVMMWSGTMVAYYGSWNGQFASQVFNNNDPHQFAGVGGNGTTIAMYIDKVGATGPGGLGATSHKIVMGGGLLSHRFDGKIMEAARFDIAMGQVQVDNLYDMTFTTL